MAGCHRRPVDVPVRAPDDAEVAVGYGTMDKRQVIKPVYSLTDSEVERVRFAHIEELLQGRVPGLRVDRLSNGEFSIRIRGTRSFADNGEPLVVIDGVPAMSLARALGRVTPGDVERVDVLQGAAASIYGSRGANGVILITTKRGR
jgi:TonB-dependent SusC/RagA subfamily outer membrane receptor